MKRSFVMRALLTGACGMAISTAAYAQNAAEESTDAGEIVVTAQNRAQNVQDVPIAINVVSAAEIQKTGFTSMSDIAKIAPEVQLNNDGGTVKITVRGVGTNSNDEAQDTSVVANIDGEYINQPRPLSTALFDLERVEVLRGPQGTLYGRNSTGGAINFITRKPGNEFAVNASASYGNYNAIRLDAGVDLPLGANAAVRVAGFYEDRDGYTNHPARAAFNYLGYNVAAFAGGRSDDNNAKGGRISFKYEPSDALTINLAGEYSTRKYHHPIFATYDFFANPASQPSAAGCATGPGFTNYGGAPSGLLMCIPSTTNYLASTNRASYDAPAFGLGEISQKTHALRARIAYKLSDAATLTYTGGYRYFSGQPGQVTTLPFNFRNFAWDQRVKTQSHELRLNGDLGGIIYQLGGFYFKETTNAESAFVTTFGPNVVQLTYFKRQVDTESKSAFGQVDVPLGDKLTLVGGLRYTDNRRSSLPYGSASPFGAGPPDPQLFNGAIVQHDFSTLLYRKVPNLKVSENKLTWLVGLNYKPDSRTLIYAKASTGFKGGGFDAIGNYKPESNTAIEAGLKKSFGDHGQHIFNLTAFHYDYRDLQVAVLLDSTIGGQIFNAGKAEIWGVEASSVIALSDNDRFSASFNYLHARYKSLLSQPNVFCFDVNAADTKTCNDPVPNFDYAGNTPPFSPTFVITAGYEHTFHLGNAGKLTASVNTTLKSAYFTDFFNYRDGQQSAFTQTDLSLTYKPESGRFSVQAFARNLEDNRPLTYGGFVAAGPTTRVYNWQFGTPRTYGIRVGVDF